MQDVRLDSPWETYALAFVLRAAGLVSWTLTAGCTDRPVGDSDGVATTTTASTAATTDTTREPTTTTGATTDTTREPATTTTSDLSTSDADCTTESVYCFAPPTDTGGSSTGTTGEATGTGTTGETTGGGLCDGVIPDVGFCAEPISPVFEQNGECCVKVAIYGCSCGRPFLVEETARCGAAMPRDDWSLAAAPALAGLTDAERSALAAAWITDGLAEHASVAAFARLVLQLLAVGAPAALVAEAQQAMADEVEHARLCFGLAAAYGGRELGPSALPLAGVLAGVDDLTAIAVGAVREGCISETIAALQAEAARTEARDPVVRAVLARIAADELRHAAHAWRCLAWALERGGSSVHAACSAAFAAAESAVSSPPQHVDSDISSTPHGSGRLDAAGRAWAARRAMAAVIAPAARALLAHHSPRAAA